MPKALLEVPAWLKGALHEHAVAVMPALDAYVTAWNEYVRAVEAQRAHPGDSFSQRIQQTSAGMNSVLSYTRRIVERELDHILLESSPRQVLNFGGIEQKMVAFTESGIGFNRYAWVLAVGSRGSDDSSDMLRRYVRTAECHLALQYVGARLGDKADASDLPFGIALNHRFEELLRTVGLEVRFAWVARLILAALASEYSARPDANGWLTVDSAAEYWRVIEHQPSDSLATVSKKESVLAHALSTSAETYPKSTFESLYYSVDIENFPWVEVDGLLVLVAPQQGILYPECAILRRLRSDHGGDVTGSVFEGAVQSLAAQLLPDSFVVPHGPVHLKVGSARHEVDLHCSGKRHDLVGEAKSYIKVGRATDVINSFGDQISKAVRQVRTRVGATSDGELSEKEIHGLVVTMHSYGGAVWDPSSLREVGVTGGSPAVIPLHHMCLVFSVMLNETDLVWYLRLRAHVIGSHWVARDEVDLLAFYLARREMEMSGPPPPVLGAAETQIVFVPSVMISAQATLVRPPAQFSRREWRRFFMNSLMSADY